ncbi:lipase 1-like [Topomyia yanbarensis]|uniref:lipase 1-like n=1 Tax=Topomyia yanbarensis TaxID=2498891 RepID=UPI00273ACDA1|nr:lipase 1-like [Topomyia yanbarensis]XP_058839960.1 lipase 1-like [Topomyia yanbarensis]
MNLITVDLGLVLIRTSSQAHTKVPRFSLGEMVTVSWWVFFACTLWTTSAPATDEDLDGENDIGPIKKDTWFKVDDEDGDLTVPELITKYGYQMESHAVTTEDGYMLTMFRIFPRQPSETKKFPVLMVHGFLGSSADFVVSGPNNSLAYLLAENGYDVWLANVRGTRYSRNHTTMLVETFEYWDFSWHEIGYYDLPAMIDHVLNKSSASKLQYIGHSQGCTTYFVMSSTRPKYNKKIVLMTALAPAVIITRVRSPILRVMLEIQDQLKEVLDSLNIYEIPYVGNRHHIIDAVCPPEEKNNLCTQLIGQITGPHPEMWDQRLANIYMGHAPSGAATKQLYHYNQLTRSWLFRQYDYGKKGNLQTYSNWKPPNYNLKLSSAPVQIYYGLNDWMVHPRDVQQFAAMLPRLVASSAVADRKFNHIDFLLAKNVRTQVYDKLMPVLERYNNNNHITD